MAIYDPLIELKGRFHRWLRYEDHGEHDTLTLTHSEVAQTEEILQWAVDTILEQRASVIEMRAEMVRLNQHLHGR